MKTAPKRASDSDEKESKHIYMMTGGITCTPLPPLPPLQRVRTVAWTPPLPPAEALLGGVDADGDGDLPDDVLAYDPAMLKNNVLASTVLSLAVMGIMPLAIKSKRFYFRSTLPLCVLAYAVVCAAAVHLLAYKLPLVVAVDDGVDLDERMVALELTVHLLPLGYVPVVWRQSRNISRITRAHFRVKDTILGLGSASRYARRRRVASVLTCVLLVLSGVVSVGGALMVEELALQPIHVPLLAYTIMFQTVLWWNMVLQLSQAKLLAQNVLTSFQQATSGGAASAGVVRYHRAAWMRVRDLLGYDDVQTNVVYVLNMVYLLVQSIMVSFETLSFYSAGKALACAAHGIFAVTYFMEICVLCDCAHRASALMNDPFVMTLDEMSLNYLDRDAHKEVCFFYNTIMAKPPDCSIRGFMSLDRPFFASVTTTIVSYLIFLAQFRADEEEADAAAKTEKPPT